eukprot:6348861-Amphidinium_carterae.1
MKRIPGSSEGPELHDRLSQPRSLNHGSQPVAQNTSCNAQECIHKNNYHKLQVTLLVWPDEGVDGSDPEKLSSL